MNGIASLHQRIVLLQLIMLILLICEVTLKLRPLPRENDETRLNQKNGKQVQERYNNNLRGLRVRRMVGKGKRYRKKKGGESMKEKRGKLLRNKQNNRLKKHRKRAEKMKNKNTKKPKQLLGKKKKNRMNFKKDRRNKFKKNRKMNTKIQMNRMKQKSGKNLKNKQRKINKSNKKKRNSKQRKNLGKKGGKKSKRKLNKFKNKSVRKKSSNKQRKKKKGAKKSNKKHTNKKKNKKNGKKSYNKQRKNKQNKRGKFFKNKKGKQSKKKFTKKQRKQLLKKKYKKNYEIQTYGKKSEKISSKKLLEARSKNIVNEMRQTGAYKEMQSHWDASISIAPAIVSVLSQLTVIGGINDFKLQSGGQTFHILTAQYYSSAIEQLGSSAAYAFGTAEKNTDEIRAETKKIPASVTRILGLLKSGTVRDIDLNVPGELKMLTEISKKCGDAADAVAEAFNKTMFLITEMNDAFTSTKAINNDDVKKVKLLKVYLQNNITNKQKALALITANKAKVDKQLLAAQKKYDDYIAKIPTGWSATFQNMFTSLNIGNTLVGVADVMKAVNPEMNAASQVTSGLVQEQQDAKISDQTAYQMAAGTAEQLNGFKEELEEADAELQSSPEKDCESISKNMTEYTGMFSQTANFLEDHLDGLQDGKPKQIAMKMLRTVSGKMDEFSKDFQESPNAKQFTAAIGNILPQVEKLIPSFMSLASVGTHINQQTQLKSQYLPHEEAKFQPGSNARAIAEMQNKQVQQLRAQSFAQEKQIEDDTDEANAMSARMSNMKVELLNLNETIKLVTAAIEQLSKMKCMWSRMSTFFDHLATIVNSDLSGYLTVFNQYAGTSKTRIDEGETRKATFAFTKQILYNNAFQAMAMGDAAMTIAETYYTFSQTFVLDQLNSLGELSEISAEKRQNTLRDLEKNRTKASAFVTHFVKKERRKFAVKLENQTQQIQCVFNIVGQPSASLTQAIQIGAKAAQSGDFSAIAAMI